jgi:transposase
MYVNNYETLTRNLIFNIFKSILTNYINYFKNRNKKLYLSSLMKIVRDRDINDISYSSFMTSITYFQESYISILIKK